MFSSTRDGHPARTDTSRPHRGSLRRWMAALEVVVAATVIVLDLAIPSLVILALAGVSLALRRQGFASLGFRRLTSPVRTSLAVLLLTSAWSVVQLGLVMPIANRITDSRQDLSVFADLKGNVALFLGLLLASWTLAAVVEETVFRGYLPTRVQEVVGAADSAGRLTWPAVLVPAVLFACVHLEQGQVGVLVTFLDSLFFIWIRVRYRSVWAAVLAHGFSNTLGLTTFFLVGPLYGLW